MDATSLNQNYEAAKSPGRKRLGFVGLGVLGLRVEGLGFRV